MNYSHYVHPGPVLPVKAVVPGWRITHHTEPHRVHRAFYTFPYKWLRVVRLYENSQNYLGNKGDPRWRATRFEGRVTFGEKGVGTNFFQVDTVVADTGSPNRNKSGHTKRQCVNQGTGYFLAGIAARTSLISRGEIKDGTLLPGTTLLHINRLLNDLFSSVSI